MRLPLFCHFFLFFLNKGLQSSIQHEMQGKADKCVASPAYLHIEIKIVFTEVSHQVLCFSMSTTASLRIQGLHKGKVHP